jgi:hypothetical protein
MSPPVFPSWPAVGVDDTFVAVAGTAPVVAAAGCCTVAEVRCNRQYVNPAPASTSATATLDQRTLEAGAAFRFCCAGFGGGAATFSGIVVRVGVPEVFGPASSMSREMPLPQALQNFAPLLSALPQCGHFVPVADTASCSLLSDEAAAVTLSAETAAAMALCWSKFAPHPLQNFAPAGTERPQALQVVDALLRREDGVHFTQPTATSWIDAPQRLQYTTSPLRVRVEKVGSPIPRAAGLTRTHTLVRCGQLSLLICMLWS